MFYEENQLNEHLICPYCKNKYSDPRFIECGVSFCHSCIELLISSDDHGFKCPICDDFHETPKKGYAKNLNLLKLCEMKANEVSRSPLAQTLQREQNSIGQLY